MERTGGRRARERRRVLERVLEREGGRGGGGKRVGWVRWWRMVVERGVDGLVGVGGGGGLVVEGVFGLVVLSVFGFVLGREEGHFAAAVVDGFRVPAGEDEDVRFFTLPPGPKPRMERRASPGIVSALRAVQCVLSWCKCSRKECGFRQTLRYHGHCVLTQRVPAAVESRHMMYRERRGCVPALNRRRCG